MKRSTLNKRRTRGLSLIELMVALTIGTVLVSGAVLVYSQSRTTHTVNDTIARLQENGRYVFSVLEPDIQLAGYYGFTNAPDDLHFMSSGSTGSVISASKLQADAGSTAVGPQECGKNFAVNVLATLEGSNNAYGLASGCAAQAGGYRDGSDGITIRRASNPPADGKGKEDAKRVQILLSRLSPTSQYIFADGTLPEGTELKAGLLQVRDMLVHSYYISKDSTQPDAAGLPALRVRSLVDGPSFDVAKGGDTEVMRGVEDMQVQFGIDYGDYNGDGKIDDGRDVDKNDIPDVVLGIATRYVNPDAVPKGAQIVSVRIWVLMRAEQRDPGFVNKQTYKYADRELAVDDNFRRVLLSRTITLRNSRTL